MSTRRSHRLKFELFLLIYWLKVKREEYRHVPGYSLAVVCILILLTLWLPASGSGTGVFSQGNAITIAAAGTGFFTAANDITTAAYSAQSVFAADVDGDGDMDVLSASSADDTIAWYENDSSGSFTAHHITIAANGACSVCAVDVDGDGDMDVLSASSFDDTIAWYENDGSANFTPHDITTAADSARDVFAADVDGDGDIDVLSASAADDTIAWYENDGSENFTAHDITTSANFAQSVFAVDVDGDGDMDVLCAGSHMLAWYENDGSEMFTAHDINTTIGNYGSVFATDVNGDGDMDVLLAKNDNITLYMNDGSESFTACDITTTADGVRSVFAADVDGDGDVDVLSASAGDDTITWYENDGNEIFTAHDITTAADGAGSVFAADVDGDGDMDVLSASSYDDTIAWYEQNPAVAEIDVRGNGITIIDGDATPSDTDDTDFGGFFWGPGVVRTFTIHNLGGANLVLSGFPKVLLDDANHFSVSAQPGSPVTPMGTITFNVTFAPNDVGAHTSQVSIACNDDDENPYTFLVSGTCYDADFGDAPSPYPVTSAEDGPRHGVTGPTLGATRDNEYDGTHSDHADADGADEDGVSGWSRIWVGGLAYVTVNVQGAPAKLDAWIDWNHNGSWNDSEEQVANSANMAVGDNIHTFNVPSWAASGSTFARFRLSSAGGSSSTGSAADGEVEDYEVAVVLPPPDSGVFGAERNISTTADNAQSVFAADVDGDGDMDALFDAWYENLPSAEGPIFSTHPLNFSAVDLNDLDGDGDIDLLSHDPYIDGEILWGENDGYGFFATHAINNPEDCSTECVFATDIDNDGDVDILAATTHVITGEDLYFAFLPEVALYYNNGNQSFSADIIYEGVFEIGEGQASDIFSADMDGDGDVDVLVNIHVIGVYGRNTVLLLENNGRESFYNHYIIYEADGSNVSAADIDGDGDLDVLSGTAWYRNIGSQNFTKKNISSLDASDSLAVDLDGDGDMDVLACSESSDAIVWYKNDGSENFTSHDITTASGGACSVFAADLDGDGDLDVLSASQDDDTISWYEQLGPWTLTVTSSSNGSVVPGGDILVPHLGMTNFAIMANAYCYIDSVVTNGGSIGSVSQFTWENITANGTLHAIFNADLAAQGTPHWWMADYGWTDDFDVVETGNPDNDPYTTAQEYVLDYSPVVSNGYFCITAVSNNSPFTVYFESSALRNYCLLRRTNLTTGTWATLLGPRIGAGGADSMTDGESSERKFYKLRVEVP